MLTPRIASAYAAMIALAAALVVAILRAGASLTAPPPDVSPAYGVGTISPEPGTLLHVLLALVVVITLARVVGAAFRYIQQPPVIGEVVAGLMLGPSLLGQVWPEAMAYVLPPAVAPHLFVLSQVGVILYMFLVGLELDTTVLRKSSHTAIAVSHAGIVVPFLLGATLALWLYPRLSSADVPFTVFALFLGLSMSITAFPVLARILTDRRMQRTELGVLSLGCAAVNDVTAWCLLAFVVSLVSARVGGAFETLAFTLIYIVAVVKILRPLMARFAARVDRRGTLSQADVAVVLVAIFGSSVAAEYIGIHAIFGAFLLGVIVPHDGVLARDLGHRMEDFVVVLLLPAFFAFTGMRTSLGLVSGVDQWMICALIVAVACLGKIGGTYVAARVTGLSSRTSAALGVLMNTRGLMELIVLNVGLDLGVLGPTLFAMMVVMALVTTMMTAPLLHVLTDGGARNQP